MVLLIYVPAWLPTILSPFIAASAAIIATIIANRYAERRFFAQLTFDESQKVKQREADLRKDICLEAIDAIAKLQEALSNSANDNIPVGGFTEITKGASGSLAKALMIGTPDTCQSILETQDAFTKFALWLVKKRIAIEIEINNIRNIAAEMEEVQNRRTALATECQTAFKEERREEVDASLDLLQAATEKFSELTAQNSQANNRLISLRLDMFLDVARVTGEFATIAMEAIYQFRKELELTTDESKLRGYITESSQRRDSTFQDFHYHLLQTIKEFSEHD